MILITLLFNIVFFFDVVNNLISDTAVYGVKKVFNPKSLPATKGDIETMLTQIQELQQLLVEMKFKSKYGFNN